LNASPDIIRVIKSRKMSCAGHIERMGHSRNACHILVGNPGGKRPLGRPRRRWETYIRMNVREIEWGSVDWIHLYQCRALVITVMNLRVP